MRATRARTSDRPHAAWAGESPPSIVISGGLSRCSGPLPSDKLKARRERVKVESRGREARDTVTNANARG